MFYVFFPIPTTFFSSYFFLVIAPIIVLGRGNVSIFIKIVKYFYKRNILWTYHTCHVNKAKKRKFTKTCWSSYKREKFNFWINIKFLKRDSFQHCTQAVPFFLILIIKINIFWCYKKTNVDCVLHETQLRVLRDSESNFRSSKCFNQISFC